MITFKKRTSEVWSRPQVWSTPLNFLKFFKTNFFYSAVCQGHSSCKLKQSRVIATKLCLCLSAPGRHPKNFRFEDSGGRI